MPYSPQIGDSSESNSPKHLQPLFIVGTGRSGTTLLRLMFNSHPEFAVPYETHFIPDYIDANDALHAIADPGALDQLIERILSEPMLKKWDFVPTSDQVRDLVVEKSVAGVIDSVFRCYALASGKTRWGDKSAYLSRMHLIRQLFPQARFIHIVRDGRDVAMSVIRLPWGPSDIIEAAEWWRDLVSAARVAGCFLGPQYYTEVRYEDLVADPAKELSRLCSFAGEQYSAKMLDYPGEANKRIPTERLAQHKNIDAPPDVDRTYAWTREMSDKDIVLFTEYAREPLASFDYKTPEMTWSHRKLEIEKACVYLLRGVRRLRSFIGPTSPKIES